MTTDTFPPSPALRRAAFALAFLLVPASRASADRVHEIRAPLFSQPGFLQPGGAVAVRFVSDVPAQAVRALLSESLAGAATASVVLDFPLPSGTNDFEFKLPDSLGPGMYDLCVDFERDGKTAQDCQPHSVVVVKSFEPPFTVAQVTDYHMGDPRAERSFPGVDIRRVRLAALQRAAAAKPAFILLTGDVDAYPVSYESDYPASAEELIANAKVPLVILPGNHDFYASADADGGSVVDGATFWPKYFGPRHRVLDYGPFRFIGFDSYDWPLTPRVITDEYHKKHGTAHTWQGGLSRSEYAWLVDALDGADKRTPVLAAHHDPRNFEADPSRWCKDCVKPGDFLSALAQRNVPYYVYGHVHRNEDYVDKGVRFTGTGSVGSDVDPDKDPTELWSIRLFRFEPDRTMETETVRLFDAPPQR